MISILQLNEIESEISHATHGRLQEVSSQLAAEVRRVKSETQDLRDEIVDLKDAIVDMQERG